MKKNNVTAVTKSVKNEEDKTDCAKSFNWKNNRLTTTRKIVYTALLTAVATISNAYLTIPITQDFWLTLNLTCFFIAGVLLDLPLAITVGALSDVLGWVLNPKFAFNPFFTLSSAILCATPGLIRFVVTLALKRGEISAKKWLILVVSCCFSYILCYFLCTGLINSFGLWVYMLPLKQAESGGFWIYLALRLIQQLPNTIVNLILSIGVAVSLSKIKYFSKFIL